jgi:hypothetical protein
MLYFDTGLACGLCSAPVVRPIDQDEPTRSCSCLADRHEPEEPQRGAGALHALLPIALSILVAAAAALVLACGAPRSHALAPPTGCTYAPLPLRVQIDPGVAFHSPALFAAAEDWTRALGKGRPALIFVTIDPDVVVTDGPAGSDGHRVLVTTACTDGGRARSTVVLDSGLDAVAIRDFAVHGFGHALGVAHSTNAQSVMQGVLETGLLAGEPGPDAPFPPSYRVTEGDARAALAQKRWQP